MDGETITKPQEHEPVASYRHSLVFLVIVAAVVAMGYVAQHRAGAGPGLVDSHAHVIPIYLSAAILDWLLVLFAWRGVRRRGGTLSSIVGGRWMSAREVVRDLGIAALFWGAMVGLGWAMDRIPAQGAGKSLDILFPKTPLEVGVWLLTAVSAGFCEEFVFRGYVLRQLLALSDSTTAAVLGQGVIFGVMHVYQGWIPVLHITVLGILFGVLAVRRRTLRVGMIAHGWYDIWAGWLANVLLR
jgi:membrane protease YdiL (CAAX protease family)